MSEEVVLERIRTAEQFLEMTRNSKLMVVGPYSHSPEVLAITIHFYSEDHKDVIVKTYLGPDPNNTPFAIYMKFVAELYSTPGLQGFVNDYMKNWFRRFGRMID